MLESKEIIKKINKNIMGGVKVPHRTSLPVIRQENDDFYLAVFVFFFNRDDVVMKVINRPTLWALVDLENGDILKEYDSRVNEFSDAPYDVKYSTKMDTHREVSKEYYDEALALLDYVREQLLTTGKFPMDEYDEYLKKILINIPKNYHQFYFDLSI